jgi:hypothetical protein
MLTTSVNELASFVQHCAPNNVVSQWKLITYFSFGIAGARKPGNQGPGENSKYFIVSSFMYINYPSTVIHAAIIASIATNITFNDATLLKKMHLGLNKLKQGEKLKSILEKYEEIKLDQLLQFIRMITPLISLCNDD